MKSKILILTMFFMTTLAFSQTVDVSGAVTDSGNMPLPGVNVIVKNTAKGTSSNFDGLYTLNEVPVNSILVFTYIGFLTQEIVVTGDSLTIDVVLREDAAQLDEVVVVGYGTQKKSNVVGSVSSIDAEEATAIPTANVSEMLRGRAAGVQVSLDDARPGGNSNILIRGNRTVVGSSSPLIVVDGLPFDSLNDIAADDIANIEVLKDAASTAIYGSRAANGVILITTKSGKTGKISVNYHGYTTVQSPTINFNQYTGQQFIDLRREANRNRITGDYLFDVNIFTPFEIEAIENGDFVDWRDLVFQDATLTSHSLSVTAGSEKTKVFSSINYFSQDGIIPNSGFDRGTFKLNLDQKINDKLSINAILNYQNAIQDRETGGLNFTTITPLAKPFDDNGELLKFYLGANNTNVNPLWDQQESTDEEKINLTDVNLNLVYKLSHNLTYKLRTFIRNRNTNRGIYRTSLHSTGDEGVNGRAFLENTLYKQSLIENIITYTPEINDNHSLDLTAVQAFDEQQNEFTQIQKIGFSNDELGFNGNATNLLSDVRDVNRRRLLSFMGRLRYGYLDKYLFEFTARADASSVFSEDNKWGYFPAASFAWKAHEESFLENVESINELKFRVSYGTVGNQSIPTLGSLGVSDNVPYTFLDSNGVTTVSGGTPSSQLPNPDLKWESSTTFNIGVDFRLFNNLFEGSFEYYNSTTKDLIVARSLPEASGYAFTLFNSGEIQNKGIETSLTTNIIRKEDLQWSIGINVTSNKNKVLRLTGETDANGQPIDITLADGRRFSVGQSINNIWLPLYDGIWQEGEDYASYGASPGDVRVIDQNGDFQIDNRDNVFTETDPDWYGSFNTTINYKGLELFADFYAVDGAIRLNPVLADGELWKGAINGIRTKYYTPEQPSTEYPRPKPDTHLHLFSFAVKDASYLRLRTLTLGYNFSEETLSTIGLNSAKVYVTGTNLLTFTDYLSYSPEQIGFNPYPETRNITLGVKLGF